MTSSLPPLRRGERRLVLVHDAPRNRNAVATRHAVYYQGHPRDLEPWQRMGWEQIDRIDWDAGHADLTFVGIQPRTTPKLVLRLGSDHRLVDLARERIAATTLLQVPICRSGRTVGRLTARRPADGTGDVRWVVHATGAEVPDDEVARAIRQLRVQAGV